MQHVRWAHLIVVIQRLTPLLGNLFAFFDKDHDGLLSSTELECMMNARGRIATRIVGPIAEIVAQTAWEPIAEAMCKHGLPDGK